MIRSLSVANLEHIGVSLNNEKNEQNHKGIAELQDDSSRVKVLKIPTNEELEIALQSTELVEENQ